MSILLVLLLVTNVTAQSCVSQQRVTSITVDGCIPRRVVMSRCEGRCSSYVRPSPDNTGLLERHCMCCEEDDSKMVSTAVMCRYPPHWRRLRIQIPMPKSCRCRPCRQVPESVVPMERNHGVWGSVKRSVATTANDDVNHSRNRTLKPTRSRRAFIQINDPSFSNIYRKGFW